MAPSNYEDPLYLDVKDDLRRVDEVMTRILKDRATWSQFIQDPNGVLVRLGLHPPTSELSNDRANRIFYATLTNRPLLELLVRRYEAFKSSNEERFRRFSQEAAGEGRIAHDVELDLEAFDHALTDKETLQEILQLSLHDLNRKQILNRQYSTEEVDDFIAKWMEAAERRRPIAAFPLLEEWDRNYGVQFAFGGRTFAELGFATTVGAIVEVALGGTNAAIVYQVLGFWGPPTFTARAVAAGDETAVRGTAIVGRLLDFTGELLEYVNRFERGRGWR